VPTDTPVPAPKPAKFGFSYASVWYHFINVGHKQHLQVQDKSHGQEGIWVTVQFASGLTKHWYTLTDKTGLWKTDFTIPGGTVSAKSNRAVVTFQLWKGKRTAKTFSAFYVVRH
jgi:hypothetical protein